MLAVLLESRARRPKRAGDAAFSVAVHVAIIGAVVVTAAHGGTVTHRIERAPYVRLTVPRNVARERPLSHQVPTMRPPTGFAIPRFDMPVSNLSFAINLEPKVSGPAWPAMPTCISCRGGVGSMADAVTRAGGANGGDDNSAWRGSELLMRIVASAVPRFPERLRDAGVEGSVLVQFVVDTTGRVEMSSIKVMTSTHELFTEAVRDALARFRFRPAELTGHRVEALAQMPFEF
ncbi:MAG TPA: energy transducer TonB, partial [Gemmatimonadaceae bacterium]|nr:energy transducer TonB [Gemmatimonadaceae bacterium]